MEILVYVSISLAIALAILGFIMLLKYRRFGMDKIELLDQKINTVNNVLDNCESMINELNKLSDYIISSVEEKSAELRELVDKADEKIKTVKKAQQPRFEARLEPENIIVSEKVENVEAPPKKKATERTKKSAAPKTESKTESIQNTTTKTTRKKKTVAEDNIVVSSKAAANAYKANAELANNTKEEKTSNYVVDTVLIDENEQDNGKMYAFVVNSKVKDVTELSQQGYEPSEIAKRLKIGIGEIELILGIKK